MLSPAVDVPKNPRRNLATRSPKVTGDRLSGRGPGDSSGNAPHENDLGMHFKSNGYPPPHPLATEFPAYDMADSIASVEDVVVPVPVRKSTSEIVDGLSRCRRLIARGVPWDDVPKVEVN